MNNNEKLRWGILGAARINERLLPAIVDANNAELVAIASRREGAAAETLAKYAPHLSNIAIYSDLESLLIDPAVQAIYIPMANQEHAHWALKALEHGKHVLCEKPLALTVADIDAIQTTANQKNLKVMEGFMYRFHPQHLKIMEIINAGLIGEIRSVRAHYSFMMRPARMYRLAEATANGGGAMWDIGCYAIHSIRMFFSETPKSVIASAKYVESGADTSMSGVLDFNDGRFAQFDFSFERARRCEYEVIGTQGGLKCHVVWQLPGDVPIISWWNEDGRSAEERLLPANHFRLEIEHFSECVLDNKNPALSVDDARENCKVIVAAHQAAKHGQQVLI